MAFRGEHYHSVDDKGRVIIPALFRKDLGDSFMITRGWNGCLFAYPLAVFSEIEQRLQEKQFLNQSAMDLKRWFVGSAVETAMDSQFRVAIPQKLRHYARIMDEVVLVGTTEKAEIWSRENWEAFNIGQTEESLRQAAIETGLGALT